MDDECVSDALLAEVVQQAQADRLAICDVYDNPEKAWLDGYVAGWFAGHFKRTQNEPVTEPMTVL